MHYFSDDFNAALSIQSQKSQPSVRSLAVFWYYPQNEQTSPLSRRIIWCAPGECESVAEHWHGADLCMCHYFRREM